MNFSNRVMVAAVW